MMDVDLVQQQLGGWGRYQVLVNTLLGLVYMRGAWHTLGIIYLGAVPQYTCVPQVVDNTSLDECHGTDGITCQAWNYSNTVYTSTIASEWDLVCNQDFLIELSTTIYMIGTALGALVLTPLSDKYGRKPLMLTCLIIQAGFGFGTAFVNSYVLFTVLRCIVGFLNMGIALSAFVTLTEVFPASHRTLPSIAIQIFWATGVMSLALFAYLVRDWRHLEMLISLPNLLSILYIWFLPESLPWLMSKSKIKDAKKVIQWAVKLNKLDLNPNDLLTKSTSDSLISRSQSKEEVHFTSNGTACYDSTRSDSDNMKTQLSPLPSDSCGNDNTEVREGEDDLVNSGASKLVPNALDLVRTPRMRLYAMVMWFLFFVNSLGYFGISLSTPNLHGDPFLNLFLMGLVEVPAYIICMLIINWAGRRAPVCIFLLICGSTSIAAVFVPAYPQFAWVKVALIMVGKFGITGSYSTIYLLASEIFPTSVRNQAVGIASFFENIGSISSPFMVYAAKTYPRLPLICFGVLTIIGSLVVLLLPETRLRPLPQTIKEIESWGKQQR